MRLALLRARLRVFWQTTRMGVMGHLHPTAAIVRIHDYQVGFDLVSGDDIRWGIRASIQTLRPYCREPAVS